MILTAVKNIPVSGINRKLRMWNDTDITHFWCLWGKNTTQGNFRLSLGPKHCFRIRAPYV